MLHTPKSILLLLFFLGTINLSAQGLLIDDDSDQRYEALPQLPNLNDGGKSEEKALEGITQWSLKAYCPKPKHQGTASTCVGWAVAYAALTIQKAIANKWKGQTDLITQRAFSPMFVYNQIKISDCTEGAHVDAAMQLLVKKGDLRAATFDQSLLDCTIMPTDEELAKAAKNKIIDFHTLFSYKANVPTKINRIKLSLIQNRPVVVGMSLLNNFQQLRKGVTFWNPQMGSTGRYGGHALVVVGFDDSKGAFELMNSWGTEWGNQGFVWVKYQDFARYCKYGFQMQLDKAVNDDQYYAGQFQLRRFEAMRANGQALFSNERVQLVDGVYTLPDQTVNDQTIFQFLVNQVSINTYLYALGLEADGTIKTYWPEPQESSLLSVPEMELYIPAADAGLQFKKSGTEHIILLYSNRPIMDIEQRKLAFQQVLNGSILERLQAIFGEDLLDTEQISYDPKAMKFSNKLETGKIIPVVLTLNVQ